MGTSAKPADVNERRAVILIIIGAVAAALIAAAGTLTAPDPSSPEERRCRTIARLDRRFGGPMSQRDLEAFVARCLAGG
jgi:hypothetical protein